MKYDLIIRPAAEQDMQDAYGWYEDRVSRLGKEFLRCVDAAIAQINRAPATHPVLYQGIRRILTRRFPFGIFYIVAKKEQTQFVVENSGKNVVSLLSSKVSRVAR